MTSIARTDGLTPDDYERPHPRRLPRVSLTGLTTQSDEGCTA